MAWGSRKEVLSVHTPLFIREEIELKLPKRRNITPYIDEQGNKSAKLLPWRGRGVTEGPIILLA